MTEHYRTRLYGATKAILLEGNTLAGDRVFVERATPLLDSTGTRVTATMPLIVLDSSGAGSSRQGQSERWAANIDLTVEVFTSTERGEEEAAEECDTLAQQIKQLLLGSQSQWTRTDGDGVTTTKPWFRCDRLTEPKTARDGNRLIRMTRLVFAIELEDDLDNSEPEDAFELALIDVDRAENGGPDEVIEIQIQAEPDQE